MLLQGCRYNVLYIMVFVVYVRYTLGNVLFYVTCYGWYSGCTHPVDGTTLLVYHHDTLHDHVHDVEDI